MTRGQRLRVCANLSQLVQTARSDSAKRVYQKQLDATQSRLK